MKPLPSVPDNVPRIRSTFWRRVCGFVLSISGWELKGEFPNLPKMIVIGAPHSSYWDGVWGVLLKVYHGIDIGIMIKREVVDGPLGVILRPLGAVPIDRSAATNIVEQMKERFRTRDRMWLGITPEGTRKKVVHWKSGFLRIAEAANVPLLPLFIDYPSKSFTLGEPFYPTGNQEADMVAIRALYRPYVGKHRNTE